MPTVELFIPSLFEPLPVWKRDFGFEAETELMHSLLKQAETRRLDGRGFERALFSATGLPPDQEMPVAFYRFMALSGAALNPEEGTTEITEKPVKQPATDQAKSSATAAGVENNTTHLLCADPIHCEPGMTDITLTETVENLSENEADELLDLLNQHFADDGLKFLRNVEQDAQLGHYGRWYMQLSGNDSPSTTPLADVYRKNIFPHLPVSHTGGDQARNWQAIQNEIQMLLFNADLNRQREIAGQSSVNSLWFWGGGLPFQANSRYDLVIGGGLRGQMLAALCDCNWADLPESGQHLIEKITESRDIDQNMAILFDQLLKPALDEDTTAWQAALAALEKHYLSALADIDSKQYRPAPTSQAMKLIINPCDGRRLFPSASSGLFTRLKSLFHSGKYRSLADFAE